MEETKVYVVVERHKDREILGVFSSEEKALEFTESEAKRLGYTGLYMPFFVHQFDLDNP